MANKRMFSLSIVDSDAFLDLPLSTQALYFHLNMRADDDGFISNPKKISRTIGASEDDLKLLIMKRFVLVFEDGVIVIKHWRMHNTIQRDRYKKTNYIDDLKQLSIKENGAYTFVETGCIQNGNGLETKCIQSGNTGLELGLEQDLGLNKVLKETTTDVVVKKKQKKFVKPTQQEIAEYVKSLGKSLDVARFYDYYEAKGWLVGKSPMKDWKATVRNWLRNNHQIVNEQERDSTLDEIF